MTPLLIFQKHRYGTDQRKECEFYTNCKHIAFQFMEFENLWDREGQKMTSTYRAPQPLNGRIVECSEELNKKESVDEITLA